MASLVLSTWISKRRSTSTTRTSKQSYCHHGHKYHCPLESECPCMHKGLLTYVHAYEH